MTRARRDPRPVIIGSALAGSALADGLFFPTSPTSPTAPAAVGALARDELERRLVAAWRPGARLYDCAGAGVLLAWPAPIRVRAGRAPGQPVRRAGAGFSAAPETAAREPSADELALVVGGEARLLALREREPSAWIDVAVGGALSVRPLGGPVVPAPGPQAAPAPPEARGLLQVAPPDPDRAAVLAALEGRTAQGATGDAAAAGRAAGRARRGLRELLRALFSRGRRAGPATQPLPEPPDAAAPGLAGALKRLFSRLIMRGRLGALLGRRQARYLTETMELLERGDIQEGLRRAIPLASMRDAVGPTRPALGLPGARNNLAITFARPADGSSYTLEDTFFERMGRLYRATFERLDAQGRTNDAAFVLAELLRADDEAVAYLERKGELRMSAELAEARRVAPGLIVRQWFLAGDVERALAVARRHRAFADAVLRLQRTDPQRAMALRMVWADALASAGQTVAAVDVGLEIPALRSVVQRWLDRGLAERGHGWLDLLARKLALDDTSWDAVRPLVDELLAGDEAEDARARLGLAERLLPRARSTAAAWAARLLLRRLYADHARGLVSLGDERAAGLARASGDAALTADRPRLRDLRPRPLREAPDPVEITVSEPGALAVHDAVVTSERRMLLALGDAGVRLVDTRGRALAHFDEPAHRLVPSDDGSRVLLLAARGESWRLGRLDLGRRTAATWCDSRFLVHAATFDGDVWFVGTDRAVCALDTHAPGPLAFWTVPPDDADRVTALARDADRLTVVSGGWGLTTRFLYELPAYVLRSRTTPTRNARARDAEAPPDAKAPPTVCVAVAASPAGEVAQLYLRFDPRTPELTLCLHGKTAQIEAAVPVTAAGTFRLDQSPVWIACTQQDEGSATVNLYDTDKLRERLRLRLDGAGQVTARLQGQRLVVSDTAGRLLVVDLDDGRVATRL